MSVTCDCEPWLVLTLSGCDYSYLSGNEIASLRVSVFEKNPQLQEM